MIQGLWGRVTEMSPVLHGWASSWVEESVWIRLVQMLICCRTGAAGSPQRREPCHGIQLTGHVWLPQCVFRLEYALTQPPGHGTQALGSPGSKAGERDPCSWSIDVLRLCAGDRLQPANLQHDGKRPIRGHSWKSLHTRSSLVQSWCSD